MGSKAKLLVGKDAYILHDFGKPFPNDPFSDLPYRRKMTDGVIIFGMKMTLACFHLPGKKLNLNIALIIPVEATMAASERFSVLCSESGRDLGLSSA